MQTRECAGHNGCYGQYQQSSYGQYQQSSYGEYQENDSYRDVEITDRVKRVFNRLSASFGVAIKFESKVGNGAFGVNLFNFISLYPTIFIHVVDRKIPLEGSFAIGLETVSRKLDYFGNAALITSLAIAAITWIASADPTIAALTFTVAFVSKATAVISTLTADLFNEYPVLVRPDESPGLAGFGRSRDYTHVDTDQNQNWHVS